MSQLRFDQTKFSHQLVVTGLLNMVEDDGLTPHEAFEVLEDIKRQTWHGLAEISRDTKGEIK